MRKRWSLEKQWQTGYRTFLQCHDEIGIRQPGAPLIVADYASLEVGIQGDLCFRLFGDRQLIQMYEDQGRDPVGCDIHSINARKVFGEWLGWTVPKTVIQDSKVVHCVDAGRRVAEIPTGDFKKHPYGKILRQNIKEVWYGLAYGKSAYGFATLMGADGKFIGERVAQQMIDALLDAIPSMRKWFKWVAQFIRKHKGIYSLDGRWCDLSVEMSSGDEWLEKRGERRANNFPMQATGAGVVGDAMVRIRDCPILAELGPEDFKQAADLLKHHMVSATANGIPLLLKLQVSVGIGETYYDC